MLCASLRSLIAPASYIAESTVYTEKKVTCVMSLIILALKFNTREKKEENRVV